ALAGCRVSDRAMVVGSGGTAPSVIVGLVELGAQRITVAARNAEKAAPLLDLATRCGVRAHWCDIGDARLADEVAGVDIVVNTVPADAVAPYAQAVAVTPVLLDAIYDPWPTPLAAAVQAAGGRVISGLQMLLNQAFTQVEQFTGLPAPREAMRAALGVDD
ncbi:MAG: saccharopine dehydrogenase NADP-binding domain-containing protein, partial [Mycobacterium sp.]